MSDAPPPRRQSNPHIEALLRETERRLRRQNSVLVELARRPTIHFGNLGDALRDIGGEAAETLEVERFSVWFFTPDRQAIECVELYERSKNLHSSGGFLTAAHYPIYFKALESERVISASDAHLDPRTSAFTDSYLQPYGVNSMLDAPIRRLGQMIGVVCFEHTGEARTWTVEDENFASSIADLVSMAMEATERRQAQEALRRRVAFEQLISAISSRFVNIADEQLDGAIERTLADLGHFIGSDRTHVFMLSEDGLSAHIAYEWNAPGVEPRKEIYGELPAAAFPW